MSGDDAPVTADELEIGRRVVWALWFGAILLQIAVFCVAIYAGYRGAPWFLAIPAIAFAIFVTRVLKRYLKTMERNTQIEIMRMRGEPFDDRPPLDPSGKRRMVILRAWPLMVAKHPYALVAALLLLIAALWYGIGVAASLILA